MTPPDFRSCEVAPVSYLESVGLRPFVFLRASRIVLSAALGFAAIFFQILMSFGYVRYSTMRSATCYAIWGVVVFGGLRRRYFR
jgi:hypothetical protein